MTQDMRFLDPTVLASISNLELRARAVVQGFLSGLHKSPYHGFSVEFTEHRHYHAGDDIRHVDWKLFARSGKYYVKQYEDETNVRCHLMLDCSASMGYGSEAMTKLDYGRTLAAALAYFVLGQRDAVGLMTFDDKIRDYLPARYRQGHLLHILRSLEHLSLGRQTNVARPIADLAFGLHRKGMTILISDLLDDEAAIVKGLQGLRFKGNDVIVFHVLDHAELTFPFARLVEFEDAESHVRRTVAAGAIRQDYLRQLERFCAFYRQQCQISGIDYCLLNTSQPLDIALATYLSKRAKRF